MFADSRGATQLGPDPYHRGRFAGRSEAGFSLVSVMVTFVLLMAIGLGMLSLVTSGFEGASVFEESMQALHAAEAGLNYAVAELVARASDGSGSDEAYAGERDAITPASPSALGRSTFRVSVWCLHPAEARPPDCADDPSTGIDERDYRRVIADGSAPRRVGTARRRLEATIRRYTLAPGDVEVPGICGREGVELGQGTWAIADVGSNGDVRLDGAAMIPPEQVRTRSPRGPSTPPTVAAAASEGRSGLSGSYTWRVTFVSASGLESAGGPPSAMLRVVEGYAELTNLPLGDASIARRRIYRTRGDAPRGPWFLAGEIADNRSLEYTDLLPDNALIRHMPAFISGSVAAAGTAMCAIDCNTQIEGQIRERVRDVVCPNFLPPPVEPGRDTIEGDIVQTTTVETLRLQSLVVSPDGLTIQTLSQPGAELHIHAAGLHLMRGAILAVTGAATVYVHVSGPVVLEPDAVLGAIDSDGNLISPASRMVVLSSARDPAGSAAGTASVQLQGNNKVAAVLFAPRAIIEINDGTALRGALFGRYVRITNSAGLVFDPNEGLRSVSAVLRSTPFQYLQRWHDNPNPPGN